jgi:hypothetical protein
VYTNFQLPTILMPVFVAVTPHLLRGPVSENLKIHFLYTRPRNKCGVTVKCRGDPPPGNIVMWRGLARLIDIQLGFNLAMKIVGN